MNPCPLGWNLSGILTDRSLSFCGTPSDLEHTLWMYSMDNCLPHSTQTACNVLTHCLDWIIFRAHPT
jgi:hypothetical protein